MHRVEEYVQEIFPASAVRLRKPEPIDYIELHTDAIDDYMRLDPWQHTKWKEGNRKAIARQHLREGDIVFVYRKKRFRPAVFTQWHARWCEENRVVILPSIGMMVLRPKRPKDGYRLCVQLKGWEDQISFLLAQGLKPSELAKALLDQPIFAPKSEKDWKYYEIFLGLLKESYNLLSNFQELLLEEKRYVISHRKKEGL